MKNIHLLPTDKPSRLHLIENALTITSEYKNSVCDSEVNIYITNDEEIKDCWCLNTHTNDVYFLKGFYGIQPITKKIIITTDQDLINDDVQAIDDDFLEWFVKNPSCEEVKVGRGKMKLNDDGEEYGFPDMSLYKIIIPSKEPNPFELPKALPDDVFYESLEPKQETANMNMNTLKRNKMEKELELEVKKYMTSGRFESPDGHGMNEVKLGFIDGAKWQQKRMYSEEEVEGIIASLLHTPKLVEEGSWEDIAKWLEQFKKK